MTKMFVTKLERSASDEKAHEFLSQIMQDYVSKEIERQDRLIEGLLVEAIKLSDFDALDRLTVVYERDGYTFHGIVSNLN